LQRHPGRGGRRGRGTTMRTGHGGQPGFFGSAAS
jgi:hypothetical protein